MDKTIAYKLDGDKLSILCYFRTADNKETTQMLDVINPIYHWEIIHNNLGQEMGKCLVLDSGRIEVKVKGQGLWYFTKGTPPLSYHISYAHPLPKDFLIFPTKQ